MDTPRVPLARVVRRDEVPEEGIDIVVAPSEAQLLELARFLDIPAVTSLRAEVAVKPWRGKGLSVRGMLSARVVQSCVVTLEPVDNAISEPISVFFQAGEPAAGEVAVDPDEPDDIEPLVGGRIDVGALVVENLALSLDPYPRQPGVRFEPPGDEGGDDRPPSPFAALAALRKRRDGR